MITLDAIRDCLEGPSPAVISTCSPDGVPNVAYLSQVEYLDGQQLALSFQFFNKTRENVLANPHASLLLMHPQTAAMYRLSIEYLHTETEGPLFERMKAKLAGIASHTGMSGVFRLRGSDVYRIHAIECVPGAPLPSPPLRSPPLSALRASLQRLSGCTDLEDLFDSALDCLAVQFGIHHAMLLLADETRQQLYTVASHGYESSGIGSEIVLGDGIIGVAARERTPIRIGHMTAEYSYVRAVRALVEAEGKGELLETEIPLPGLAESRSQLAVPIIAQRELLGVLYVESPQDLRFTYDDEDALAALSGHLGVCMRGLRAAAEAVEDIAVAGKTALPAEGKPALIRFYPENASVFIDGDYMIKGVAGAILWALAQDHVSDGRVDFSNRELRLDPRIRLPDISDNLEARLILLERRLRERDACVRIERTGRGRFQLRVSRPLELEQVSAGRVA
jgi:adenylate cyclase